MQSFAPFQLPDLKLVYRVLHGHLPEHLELIDCDFFSDLQTWLQRQATEEGVDVADHGQWEAWLGHTPQAFQGRRTLEIVPDD